MLDFVYDTETYPNIFSMVIGRADTRQCWTFEISDRKDEREEMIQFLRAVVKSNGRMVGFNNIGFDYPVIHYILKNKNCSVRQIYNKAMKIITAEDKFEHLIPASKILIPQLDLYKIHHFDNKARATSLKVLEFNMRSDNIEDLPYEPGSKLSDEEKDNLLSYNKHDMYQTFLFYQESLDQIRFREELSKKYNRNFLNHNDTKIGKDYFIMRLEESGVECFGGNRKPKQTKRSEIDLGDCILPYIEFKRPEFQAVLDWLKNQKISQTKGVFNGILESDLGDLSKYAHMRVKKKKLKSKPTEKEIEEFKKGNPKCWVESKELKSGKTSWYLMWQIADNLNTIVDGFQYDFGTGGIHGSIESAVVKSDDEQIIVDQDVSSYYPSLAIVNRIYPEHLTEKFCDIYEDVYKQRKSYAKGTAENAMMKLALNGVYGDSNNQYSPFFDPKYTMTITINGQLSLCMLAERLLEVPTLKMVQINTDGLTYIVGREHDDQAQKICEQWESDTKLELERAEYKMMAIRDVNSYIGVFADGSSKNKGAYQHSGLGWHQNQSAMVIPMAAEKALVEDAPIEDTIVNHDDKMDFMLRTKVPRSSRLVGVMEDGEEIALQNTTRYYISKSGLELVKIMPPLPDKEEERRIGVNTGQKVTVCNKIIDFEGEIDYNYYIAEAEKLVKPLINEGKA